jgi:hypothetical protein
MPLLVHPVDLPDDVVEVRAADVDRDGVDELIFVSAHHSGRRPDATTLTVVDVGPSGEVTGRRAFPLDRKPILWDAGPGLWRLTGKGARELTAEDPKTLPVPTMLASLGPSTPRHARLLSDIDHDGVPELLAHNGRSLVFVQLDSGKSVELPAAAFGELSESDRRGGGQITVSARWPRTEIGDFNGDGIDDILLLNGDHMQVWAGRAGEAPAEAIRVNLPVDIDPYRDPTLPPDADRKPVERVWVRDVNGDGIIDLVVHRAVLSGSWLGATAELVVALGTGTGFSKPALIQTESAAVDVELEDVDSDGDLDLVVPQIDITLSNMARALVAKRMQVEVLLFEWDGGLSPQPVSLRSVSIPIENSEQLHVELSTDLTGDGLADMVYQEGSEPLHVYAGAKGGMSDKPWASVQVDVPAGEDSLFLHDVTGDGRPEVVVWGPGQKRGSIIVAQ